VRRSGPLGEATIAGGEADSKSVVFDADNFAGAEVRHFRMGYVRAEADNCQWVSCFQSVARAATEQECGAMRATRRSRTRPGRWFENRAHIIADERGVVTGEGGAIGDRVIVVLCI